MAEKRVRNNLESIGAVRTLSRTERANAHQHVAHEPTRRKPMWEQYRRTFRSMQALMIVVTLVAMSWTRSVTFTATFFVMMQIGAVVGAMWGHSLKQRYRRPDELSARRG
jgi:hypothetical protein